MSHNKPVQGYFNTPPLRYVGAKWQIADWIISKFPVHKIYIEPYAGSGAVFFRKPKTHLEVLNDIDSSVVNFFRVLRERTTELAMAIELTPYSREEYELSLQPCDCDELERARRFYISAWQSFGSTMIYRSGWRRMTKSEMWKSLTAQFMNEQHTTTNLHTCQWHRVDCQQC